METTTLWIKGMQCDACTNSVDNALRALQGVRDVHVDLAREEAEVGYDPAEVDVARLLGAVDEQGFEASVRG